MLVKGGYWKPLLLQHNQSDRRCRVIFPCEMHPLRMLMRWSKRNMDQQLGDAFPFCKWSWGRRKALTYLCYMIHDVILYKDFRLLILFLCWFWKELLGAATAKWRLTFPLETLEVPSFLEISWYKENNTLGSRPVVIFQLLGKKLSKIKIGVFFFVYLFLLGYFKMELEPRGKWAPLDMELRASTLGLLCVFAFVCHKTFSF